MRTLLLSGFIVLAAGVAPCADSHNYWQAAGGDNNGSFTNAAHWLLGAVPNIGHRAYFNLDASYRVTFPDGELTNNAALKPAVYAGKTVELDGSKTTLVRTYDSTAAYPTETFGIYYGGIAYAFFNFEKYQADPGPNSSIDYAISNFHYKVSSSGTNCAKVEFLKGGYNFFDPPGTTWSSAVSPYVAFFGNSGSPLVDVEIEFGAETSFRFPTIKMQGNARTNRLVFAGGKHTFPKNVYIPYTQGGTAINETDALTDIRLKAGAEVEFGAGTMVGVVGTVRGVDRRWNFILESGAKMHHASYISHYYGHLGFDIAGEWTCDGNVQLNRGNDTSSAKVVVRDGGVLKTTTSTVEFSMGVKTHPGAGSFFSVTNGTVLNGAKMLVGNASFKDAVLVNADNVQFNIGYEQLGTKAVFEDSVITNRSIFSPGWNGGTEVDFDNSYVRLEGPVYVGGFDTVGSSVATTVVNVTSGKFDLYGDNGIIYVGFPAKRYGIFNMKGGEMTATRAAPISVGWFGNGEFNLSGGTVTLNHLRTGPTYTSGTDGDREDIIRITGGVLNITSVQNGYGIGISENKNRSGRLIMDGGIVKCHQVWGSNGKSAFEANGGTLQAIQSVDYQMSGIGEAKLGAKGLTVDSDKFDITIAQSFEDKDDAVGEGRLILTGGTGSTKLTGDLSRLSFVEVKGGMVDIRGRTVKNLVLNGGVLKVDPQGPITVTGELQLESVCLALADGMTLGNTYSVLKTAAPLEGAALEKWTEAITASGLDAGNACTFSQREVQGGYELTIEVRESETTEIRLDAGTETRSGDYRNAAADSFSIVVAKDANLTLSGTLKCGAMTKSGEGALTLAGSDNHFVPGWVLADGKLSVADSAALGIGNAEDEGAGTLRDGTLEFVGEGPIALAKPLAVATETATNAVIMKSVADVTMPAPTVTAGSFIKRGAGRMVWTVEGSKTLFSGRGHTTNRSGAWPYTKDQIIPLSFDEANGTVPEVGSYGCFNVTDGEMVLRGEGEGAKANIKGVVTVGTPTKDGAVQPRLTVDNLAVDFSGNAMHFVVAPGGTAENTFVTSPEIVVTNGASVTVDTLSVNRFNTRADLSTSFVVADRSTLKATYITQPNRSESSAGCASYLFSDESRLLSGSAGISLFRAVKMVFNRSTLAKNDALDPTSIYAEAGTLSTSWIDAEFVNGSEFRCNAITPGAAVTSDDPLRFTFDDSKWIPVADGDYTFAFASPEKISVVVRNRGLVLDVPSSRTWTLNHPVSGAGGIVKQGEGTLVLGAGAAAYTGVTRCESGIVDLGGTAQAVRMAGTGRFVNGTVAAGGGIAIKVDDDYRTLEAPVLSGISSAGSFRVDLGRTDENPLAEPFRPIAVCTYEGADPNVSGWRLKGDGHLKCPRCFHCEGRCCDRDAGARWCVVDREVRWSPG